MTTEIIIEALRFCYHREATCGGCKNCPINDMDICKFTPGLLLAAADRLEELSEQRSEKPLKIKIKYFADIPKIEKIAVGDLIDLRAAKDVEMKAGECTVIPLGVGMILPEGYEAWIIPRSSTPRKFGIKCANSVGLIDNAYNGDSDEWGFVAEAMRDTTIKKGDRICQFRIMKNQPAITFEEVEHLNEKSRGGFGSTGRS